MMYEKRHYFLLMGLIESYEHIMGQNYITGDKKMDVEFWARRSKEWIEIYVQSKDTI